MNDPTLKELVANMLIVGFDEEHITEKTPICRQLRETGLGGVILFDRFFHERSRVKNIRSPEQLQSLTCQLQSCAKTPLLIAVDQEGGSVERLKPRDGFMSIPSAATVAERGEVEAETVYQQLALMLREAGINCNLAPCVDLALNPKNHVIVGLERAYGKDPVRVARYASIFATAMQAVGIVTALKHFPGHGSSVDDSHEGFVDVSETWSATELEPFKKLIESGDAPMIMSAHVYNKYLDPEYPATLSRAVMTGVLREALGFEGVIVSDDLQMGAIRSRFTLRETVTHAINAGVDMLLFGNQLSYDPVEALLDTIMEAVDDGDIRLESIIASNRRIDALKSRYLSSVSEQL